MNIRTPKRYRRTPRRSIFPVRTFLLLLFTVGVVFGASRVMEQRDTIQAQVGEVAQSLTENLNEQIATLNAPPPTATQDPRQNLIAGDNAWQVGNTTEAVRSYQVSLGAIPNNVGIHNRVALGLMLAGSIEQAVEASQRAIMADPFNSDAWAIRGWALASSGDVAAGMSAAMHATTLDPQNVRARIYLARVLYVDEQYTRARSLIDEVLNDDPDNAEALWVRGLIRETGFFEFAGALADFRAAYDIAMSELPGLASTIAVDLARIQLRPPDPNYQGAIDILQSARQMNAENTLVLFWLGRIYYSDLGDPAQAIPYLQQCVDYNPSSYNCFYLLGRAQRNVNQNAAALQSLEEATRLNSPNPRHWWWAANLYYEQGNCARASEFLRRGAELITENTPADLIDAYDFLLNTCGVSIPRLGLQQPTPEPAPPLDETTPEPDGA
ncbi:tetratricopeptide repeat protein [Aggregatilineales bacterium SYSU G02658]